MTEAERLQGDQQGAVELPRQARILLRVVYIMGVILVLLFLLLIGGIVWKAVNRQPAVGEQRPSSIDLALPAGTAIQSMLLDGDRLAINTGREVIVVDVRKNVILSRVRVSDP